MLKKWLIVLGIVFLLVGVLGLFNNPVLGLFQVNGLHNLVHLLSGVLALIFAFQSEAAAKKFAMVLGIVYALVTILGFLGVGFMSSLLANNGADNFLHLLLAIVFIALGSMKSSASAMA